MIASRYRLLVFPCRNQTSTTTRIATRSVLFTLCVGVYFFGESKPNIHYNKDCDISFTDLKYGFKGRNQTSTTTRIATSLFPLSFLCVHFVETKHPLQQGLRPLHVFLYLIFYQGSKPNIHYNKDCDLYSI